MVYSPTRQTVSRLISLYPNMCYDNRMDKKAYIHATGEGHDVESGDELATKVFRWILFSAGLFFAATMSVVLGMFD